MPIQRLLVVDDDPVWRERLREAAQSEWQDREPEPAGPYGLRLTQDCALALATLEPPLRHAAHLHLYRAAELAGTGLPMMSTWLIAIPGRPPSLLATVQGIRMVLEMDEEARTLTVTTVVIPPYLPRT